MQSALRPGWICLDLDISRFPSSTWGRAFLYHIVIRMVPITPAARFLAPQFILYAKGRECSSSRSGTSYGGLPSNPRSQIMAGSWSPPPRLSVSYERRNIIRTHTKDCESGGFLIRLGGFCYICCIYCRPWYPKLYACPAHSIITMD